MLTSCSDFSGVSILNHGWRLEKLLVRLEKTVLWSLLGNLVHEGTVSRHPLIVELVINPLRVRQILRHLLLIPLVLCTLLTTNAGKTGFETCSTLSTRSLILYTQTSHLPRWLHLFVNEVTSILLLSLASPRRRLSS